jgi:hypothetical protein
MLDRTRTKRSRFGTLLRRGEGRRHCREVRQLAGDLSDEAATSSFWIEQHTDQYDLRKMLGCLNSVAWGEVEMSDKAILVFTAKGFSTIISERGSQAWVLDPDRARCCDYLVCAQNRNGGWGSPEAPHGAGFLVGKIEGVEPSAVSDEKPRWLVRISAYARIDKPRMWDGGRNPVRYTTLSEIGIDPAGLAFEAIHTMEAAP